MKKIFAALLVAPLLFLASCGGNPSEQILGKWTFSDITFPNGTPKDATPENIAQMKEMFKSMSYNFTDKTNFSFVSGMSDEPMKGTYKITDDKLFLTIKGTTQEFKVNELTSSKLVLEISDKDQKADERFEMAFTK